MGRQNPPRTPGRSDAEAPDSIQLMPVSVARTRTRRRFLGSAGGLAVGAAVALRSAGTLAVSTPGAGSRSIARQNSDTTLTIATNRTPTDLDPHSAYDLGSFVVQKGPYETLIGLVSGTTD